MERTDPSITPDEIREIRKRLGLSQVEAGELLGGGTRAFTKYETGTVKPRASVVRLLRVLEANPDAVASLKGGARPSASAANVLPFEVTGEHIALLTDRTFPLLLRRLLSAEAQVHGLPEHGIHVAGSITTPDGGEDGRITWTDGPSHTSFLPSRFSQFQVKAGQVSPAAAAHDVVSRGGVVKPMVRAALEAGGHYIMLCAHPYTHQQIEGRESRIRVALRDAGMDIDDGQVDFRDADQVAAWVNRHPSVAAWTKEWTKAGTVGPFRSWIHWASRSEHDSSPWAEDERLHILRDTVREGVAEPRRVFRVVGSSGVGKSRLLLQALEHSEEEADLGYSIADLVLYADESEVGTLAISDVVQTLAENPQRAVVVVDRCTPETHRILVGLVQRRESSLSLVTLDDDVPADVREQTIVKLSGHETIIKVPEAPSSVIEAVINEACPGLPSEDFRRLAHFSRGFPKVAHLVAQAWATSRPIAHATEEHFAEAFVLGRRAQDRKLVLTAARLLAAFRLVRMDHREDDQLAEVADRSRDLSAAILREGFIRLIDRGVARRRGRSVVLEPRPIALRLAEEQWRRGWSPDEWDAILGGDTSPDLKVSAAKQLALLNTTGIAQQVLERVCRRGGPFDGARGILQSGQAEVLSALAEIDSSIVALQIERSLQDFPDLDLVRGDVRRHLVWALDKISFHPDSFEQGARLLLRLAVAENEVYSNNATGQFVALFPVVLGNTAAEGSERHLLLDEVAQSNDPAQRKIVVDALIGGSATGHFSRSVGPETHGSRPTIPSWRPRTRDEALAYIEGCVELLVGFAIGDDDLADAARVGLGRNLRSLAADGFIDLVEVIVHRVGPVRDSWPEALEALSEFLRYQGRKARPEIRKRIRTLLDKFAPRTVDARVRYLVTEMSWDYLCDEEPDHERRYLRQVEEVRAFAEELLREPDTLIGLLPHLSRRPEPKDGRQPQRMTSPFGHAIAELENSPRDWLEPIIEALFQLPEDQRDFDLLSGYIVGIFPKQPAAVEAFKKGAAASEALAPALPLVCWRLRIVASDIALVLSALHADFLRPWQLLQWGGGGILAEVEAHAVAPLFDALIDHSVNGYAVALNLIGMYTLRRTEVLEQFRPQLCKAAENLARWGPSWRPGMDGYHFGDLMKWLLEKGREDPDARAAALALARALVSPEDDGAESIVKPLIRLLLGNFPEIAWPIVGQVVISDPVRAWRLGYLLRGSLSSDERHDAPILALPEDVLFEWCRANPDRAPAFTAMVVPILTSYDRGAPGTSLNPCMARLLDEFGDREDVLDAVGGNIHSYFGWGSPTEYFVLYETPLSRLRSEHPSARVRRWAKGMLREIAAVNEGIGGEEDEWHARHEV